LAYSTFEIAQKIIGPSVVGFESDAVIDLG